MTHFTVLVIGDDVEGQLEPYWELDLSQEEMKDDPRAVFRVEYLDHELTDVFEKWKEEHPDTQEKYGYKSAEQWAEDFHGWILVDGGWGRYSNPNAKWDWYQIGGRWSGYFTLKKHDVTRTMNGKEIFPSKADQALKGEIDWEGMKEERSKNRKENWEKISKLVDERKKEFKNVGGGITLSDEDLEDMAWEKLKPTLFFKYGIEERVTREEYIENASVSTWAVVKDGKWYEKGKMGWWAVSRDEKEPQAWEREFQKLVDDLPDDTLITLVNCHI